MRKKKRNKTILSKDILRDKVYKKGDTVFFLLFPLNQPDFIQLFEGEIKSSRDNVDFTKEYFISITCGFDKRQIIRDFFYQNWFKTPYINKQVGVPEGEYIRNNDWCAMLNYIEMEMFEEIMDENKFSYGRYKTFFKGYTKRFTFSVNEAFVFDTIGDALAYLDLLNKLAIANMLKRMHDIYTSDSYKLWSLNKLNCSTVDFVKTQKSIIRDLIISMGKQFSSYLENDEKMVDFFRNFILQSNTKDIEVYKARKSKASKVARYFQKREGIGGYKEKS